MKSSIAGPLLIVLAAAAAPTGVSAAKLPAIKAGAKNAVPACATPGRMLSLLRARNPQLDARYDAIATEYMRHGEELGLRWDYAFYQMIVETGALTYRNGSKPGDVKPQQNNFAGLGATGKGESGESFRDIASGVRAHLQHLMMYAGERIDAPVAERTRKVQEWGVLSSWHRRFKSPITYADMAQKWAPGARGYASMLAAVGEQFEEEFCSKPDPRPELVQEARARLPAPLTGGEPKGRNETAARSEPPERVSGADLARRAVEEARAEGNSSRVGLGAATLARPDAVTQPTTILNAPKADATAPAASIQAAASIGAGVAKPAAPPPPAASTKCRVFTASYGGQKAVIIRASAADSLNYTVLDVNEGAEKRETEAFIQAYAKGGHQIGEFASQAQALEKAFDLCPEG